MIPHMDHYWDSQTADRMLSDGARAARKPTIATMPQTYRVPERFGLSAILGLMTLMSFLFGVLHWTSAPGYMFVLLAVLVLIICLAQMRWGWIPREGSIAAGAIVLPLGLLLAAMFELEESGSVVWMFAASPCLAAAGALLGYITGTIVAGVFLVLDRWEQYYLQQRGVLSPPAASIIEAEVIEAEVVGPDRPPPAAR